MLTLLEGLAVFFDCTGSVVRSGYSYSQQNKTTKEHYVYASELTGVMIECCWTIPPLALAFNISYGLAVRFMCSFYIVSVLNVD